MNNLRVMRVLRGISQDELGREVGIDHVRISRIERGIIQPTFKQMSAIAKFFKVEEGMIFGYEAEE